MANQTPSKRRRLGRNAFYPDADKGSKWYLNPWLDNDGSPAAKWDAVRKAQDWNEGWDEAERNYEPEEVPNPDPVYAAPTVFVPNV